MIETLLMRKTVSGQSNTWTKLTGSVIRQFHNLDSDGVDKLLTYGGHNGNYMNDFSFYRKSTNGWGSLPLSGSPGRRYSYQSCFANGYYYVHGGWDGLTAKATLGRYDPVTNVWVALTPSQYEICNSGMVEINGELYVPGGQNGDGLTPYMQVYNTSTNTWRYFPSQLPYRIVKHAVVKLNNKIIILGGLAGGTMYYNGVRSYDPITRTWATLADMPSALSGHTAVVLNSKIYVFGGYINGNNNYTNNMYVYDPVSNTWSSIPLVNITNRANHGCTVMNGKMYVYGGDVGGAISGELWEYTP